MQLRWLLPTQLCPALICLFNAHTIVDTVATKTDDLTKVNTAGELQHQLCLTVLKLHLKFQHSVFLLHRYIISLMAMDLILSSFILAV